MSQSPRSAPVVESHPQRSKAILRRNRPGADVVPRPAQASRKAKKARLNRDVSGADVLGPLLCLHMILRRTLARRSTLPPSLWLSCAMTPDGDVLVARRRRS